MGIEIERKFLVKSAPPTDPAAKSFLQGYIAREDGRTVRVRFDGAGYSLTIKGPSKGLARSEFEWPITEAEGQALLFDICKTRIEKTRHIIAQGALKWEIDVFAGANAGLIVAEIELPDEHHAFDRPDWLGPEVTYDKRYFNAALLDTPFGEWGISYGDAIDQATAG